MSRRRSNVATCRLASPGKPCCFCGLSEDNEIEYGKLYELGQIVTHYYCLLLSSMMQQRGRDDQGILGFLAADIEKEIRRGKRITCCHCKKIGATLGCCNTKCKRVFHLPCGLKAGSLHQFYSEFRSYCINHRPKQLIDGRVLEEVKNAESTLCYICYDSVNYRDILAMLWAPCCKKNAFFHRKCVQQLANSSGYFFKCPLCNNKKEFQDAMLEHGIFIPSQDASWELVPNAFHELLYRHNQCDAETCVCPKGRNHSSSNAKWELVLCRMCGSQGIHRHCGHLKWANSSWECVECRSILDKSSITNRQNREPVEGNAESGEANMKDIESDSDLSVGQDSNQQTENTENPDSEEIPIVKVRPGPLSYKMKEVMKVAQSQPMTINSSSSLEGTNSSTSLTENQNGDDKIVEDPNTVILLDSDEEPEDIEIISEKLTPKILTTIDGKTIEILDKQGIEDLARSRDAENLKPVIPNSPQKDSKLMITRIETMNSDLNSMNNQIVNLKNFHIQGLNPRSGIENSGIRNPVPQIPVAKNNQMGPRIISQQISNPGTRMPQNFNQRIVNNQIPNFGVISNSRLVRPQVSNQNQIPAQNFNPRCNSPQIFHLRTIGPQNSGPRNTPPQSSDLHFTSMNQFQRPMNQPIARHFPSPVNQTTPVKPFPSPVNQTTPVKQNPNFIKQSPSPIKQISTTLPNFTNPGSNYTPRNQGKTIPTNVPHVFPPTIIPAKEEESLGIKIIGVCSLPADFFDNLNNEVQNIKPTDQSLNIDSNEDFNLKRKAENPGPSQCFEKVNLNTKRSRILEKLRVKFQKKEIKEQKEMNWVMHNEKKDDLKKQFPIQTNLVEEAMLNANITQKDASAEINVRNNQPSTSSAHTTVNNYVAMPSSNMTFYVGNGDSQNILKDAGKNAGGCQRDAGTSPDNSPRHGLSTTNPSNKVGVQAEHQFITKADSRSGNNSHEDSKFSDLYCTNSEGCQELSETSSSCDSAGLIPDNVSLSDVKFRVCGSDIVQVILYDKYRIDIKMDNTGSRSPRDSNSSPLPCPSFAEDFHDSQAFDEEIPRKRIRDFEFEENTLQEFPATSKNTNIIADTPSMGVTTRERAAKASKENLDPVKTISEEINEPRKMASVNDGQNLRLKKNVGKSKTNGVDTCYNFKVSIDLNKIWDLVEAQPHLFSKYDESLCKYKTHELQLTGVCKIKNKWLLVKSQSQDDFYGVSTRSRLLYKSKSLEDLSAAKEIGPQNREETQNRPVANTNLRRGLKRKCRFPMPCR